MSSVSPILLQTISELQELTSLKQFYLGGGTSLALRYNHRESIDIDLFCSDIIGRTGYNAIVKNVTKYYGDALFGCDYPCNEDDQYVFFRFFIRKEGATIKVEILQNFKTIDEGEVIEGLRALTERDIGLLKLMSASNRASNKDIYDLDYIAENVSLIELYELLRIKEEFYQDAIHKTIFDLDGEVSPVTNPGLLLKFDEVHVSKSSRPLHTHDRIDSLPGQKTWLRARASWRRKVRHLYDNLGFPFPPLKGIGI